MSAPERPGRDLSVRRFLHSWWHETLGVDGRLWRTSWLTVRRPGEHASRHLDGRDEGLISPIRFYLVVNLVFFLLLPLFNTERFSVWSFTLDSLSELPPASTGAVERAMASWPEGPVAYRAAFDERVSANQAVYLVTVVPLVAVPLWLLLRSRRRYLAEHLLHVIGMLSFSLLTLFALGLLSLPLRVLARAGALSADHELLAHVVLLQAWLLVLFLGLERGAARFYRLRRWASFPIAVVTSVLLMLASWIYGKLLFWYTVATL